MTNAENKPLRFGIMCRSLTFPRWAGYVPRVDFSKGLRITYESFEQDSRLDDKSQRILESA